MGKPRDSIMRTGSRLISSWMGVFQTAAHVEVAESAKDIEDLVQEGYQVVGRLHSYNEVAIAPRVFYLGEPFRHLRMLSPQHALVGAACTVEEVMLFLLRNNRRLVNSGNFRKQTFVGAAMTGTHGFGPKSTVADCIVESTSVAGVVTQVVVSTVPLQQFVVTHSTKHLSELKEQSVLPRAYAVMPYSDEADPVCVTTEYRAIHVGELEPSKPTRSLPLSWWRLKVFWCIDRAIPSLRKWVQSAMNYVKLPDREVITSKRDIDSLYHPWPSLDGEGEPSFALWAFKPTYTCYNLALFVAPELTQDLIKFAIKKGREIDDDLFRCFIGVRELTDKSKYKMAGNYEGPCNAVDFYCTPSKADHLIQLQKQIQKEFRTRPHLGKTVMFGDEV